MNAAATIRADGLDWPIDAFLSARGFQRLGEWEWPHLDRGVEVETVTRGGELARPCEAGDVRWPDVLAYRVPAQRRSHALAEPELGL